MQIEPNTEQTFTLIGLVRRNNKSIPVIFISKHDGQIFGWEEQLQWPSPYKWISEPPHIEKL